MKKNNQEATYRSPGRPTLPPSERKRARNLSVSDPAWNRLDEQLKVLQIKTVSELLEKIGQSQIQLAVSDSSPLADVPIYRRLKSLISEPVAVFWSILAFSKRVCQQFDLESSDDMVYTVTMKACTIVFYIGYTHPDVLINNPSALLRWLCYRILQAESVQKEPVEVKQALEEQIDLQVIEKQLWKIGNALHFLKVAARSPDYEALKMKVIDGLTIKQISRIFKLQQLEVSKVEVSSMIKRGLASFRNLMYGTPSDYRLQEKGDGTQNFMLWEDARYYMEMVLREKILDEKSQDILEEILLKTSQDPYLDFWLNEIDYDLGSQNAKVRNRIAETLENHLSSKKVEIDRDLTFCRTREQMRQILQTYANQEAGTKLPINLLLGEAH